MMHCQNSYVYVIIMFILLFQYCTYSIASYSLYLHMNVEWIVYAHIHFIHTLYTLHYIMFINVNNVYVYALSMGYEGRLKYTLCF